MNDFYANQYNNQATEKDDHADADYLYDPAWADVKEMTCRANLCKEFILWTVNQIVNGHNIVYVTKSPEALEKGIDSIF